MSETTTKKLKFFKVLSLVLVVVAFALSFALVPHVVNKKKEVNKGYVALTDHQELKEDFTIAAELLSLDQKLLVKPNYQDIIRRLQDLEDKTKNSSLSAAIKRRIRDAKALMNAENKNEMSLVELQAELSFKTNALDSLNILSDSLMTTLKQVQKRSQRKTDSLILISQKKEAHLARNETVKVISFKNSNGNLIHYLGETKNNTANGNGVGIWNTGSIYRGEWLNNARHGIGEFSWSDGQRYKGDFVNDIRTGNGTYFWPSGERYEGEFENNKRHGNGVFYDPDGNVKFEGEWRNDKYQGS